MKMCCRAQARACVGTGAVMLLLGGAFIMYIALSAREDPALGSFSMMLGAGMAPHNATDPTANAAPAGGGIRVLLDTGAVLGAFVLLVGIVGTYAVCRQSAGPMCCFSLCSCSFGLLFIMIGALAASMMSYGGATVLDHAFQVCTHVNYAVFLSSGEKMYVGSNFQLMWADPTRGAVSDAYLANSFRRMQGADEGEAAWNEWNKEQFLSPHHLPSLSAEADAALHRQLVATPNTVGIIPTEPADWTPALNATVVRLNPAHIVAVCNLTANMAPAAMQQQLKGPVEALKKLFNKLEWVVGGCLVLGPFFIVAGILACVLLVCGRPESDKSDGRQVLKGEHHKRSKSGKPKKGSREKWSLGGIDFGGFGSSSSGSSSDSTEGSWGGSSSSD